MTNETRTEVEQVKQREDVKRALKQTVGAGPEDQPRAETRDKVWLGTHAILLLGLAAFHYVLQLNLFGLPARHPRYTDVLQKLDLSAMAAILLLAIAKLADVYLIGR